jgi:hypothetical protein
MLLLLLSLPLLLQLKGKGVTLVHCLFVHLQ